MTEATSINPTDKGTFNSRQLGQRRYRLPLMLTLLALDSASSVRRSGPQKVWSGGIVTITRFRVVHEGLQILLRTIPVPVSCS